MKRNFECNYCEYSTCFRSYTKRHTKAIYKREKNFKCKKCGYSASQTFVLKRYVNVLHRQEKNLNKMNINIQELKILTHLIT